MPVRCGEEPVKIRGRKALVLSHVRPQSWVGRAILGEAQVGRPGGDGARRAWAEEPGSAVLRASPLTCRQGDRETLIRLL